MLGIAAGIAGYLTTVQFNTEDIGSLPLLWIWLGAVISLTGATKAVKLKTSPVAFAVAGLLSLGLTGAVWLPVNAVLAETALLRANNAPNIQAAVAGFKEVRNRQPWQSQYYAFEVYRLLPSLTSFDTPLGNELLETARRGISVNPGDPENRLALGHILRAGGVLNSDRRLFRQALATYKQVLSRDAYNPRAMRFVALTFNDLGDRGQSLAWIERYNRFFAADPELSRLERRLRP